MFLAFSNLYGWFFLGQRINHIVEVGLSLQCGISTKKGICFRFKGNGDIKSPLQRIPYLYTNIKHKVAEGLSLHYICKYRMIIGMKCRSK
jgi:hypothetical protein